MSQVVHLRCAQHLRPMHHGVRRGRVVPSALQRLQPALQRILLVVGEPREDRGVGVAQPVCRGRSPGSGPMVVRTASVYCATPFTTVFGARTYLSRYALVTGSTQVGRGAHAFVGPERNAVAGERPAQSRLCVHVVRVIDDGSRPRTSRPALAAGTARSRLAADSRPARRRTAARAAPRETLRSWRKTTACS